MHTTLLIIHILFASILFGAGILTCAYFIKGFFQNNNIARKNTIKTTLKINLAIIAPCGIIQLFTGFILIIQNLKNYDTAWLATTIITFGIASFAWLIGLQIFNLCLHRSNQPLKKYFIAWLILSVVAFINVGIMIYVMSALTHFK